MRPRGALSAGLAGVLGLLVLATPRVAGALSCSDANWRSPFVRGGSFTEDREVPADVQPWLFARCAWPTQGCALVADDDMVAVSGERGDCLSFHTRITLTPERPLLVGRSYALSCPEPPEDSAGQSYQGHRLTVVDGDATPPIDFAVDDARISLGDDGCCSDGGPEALELTLTFGADAEAFFAEGGRIDITSPDGDHGSISSTDAMIELAPADGEHTFVAIAADGARGEPVILGADAIRRDAVYLPCRVASRQGVPLPLVLPFLWLAADRRRRARRSR